MISQDISNKILFLGISFDPPKGGIAQVLHTYQNMFETFNFIPTTNDGNIFKRIFILFKAIILFFKCMIVKDIRIIHLHSASNGSFWRMSIFIILGNLFNKKIIFHCHGGGFRVFYQKYPKLINFILNKCNYIIALSDIWKNFFINDVHLTNVIVIKNVMETPQILNNIIKNTDVCTFLFLGNICANKGIYDLLDVIHDNKNYLCNKTKFIIAGNGEIQKLNNTINNYKIHDLVQYVGWVAGERKRELLNISDTFILPSYYEGVPISILEAMSYHLPIISTNIGGIPEIVTNDINGFLIEPGNKKQLFNAIQKISSSKDLRYKLGTESYKKCQEYMPKNVELELIDLYNKLLK